MFCTPLEDSSIPFETPISESSLGLALESFFLPTRWADSMPRLAGPATFGLFSAAALFLGVTVKGVPFKAACDPWKLHTCGTGALQLFLEEPAADRTDIVEIFCRQERGAAKCAREFADTCLDPLSRKLAIGMLGVLHSWCGGDGEPLTEEEERIHHALIRWARSARYMLLTLEVLGDLTMFDLVREFSGHSDCEVPLEDILDRCKTILNPVLDPEDKTKLSLACCRVSSFRDCMHNAVVETCDPDLSEVVLPSPLWSLACAGNTHSQCQDLLIAQTSRSPATVAPSTETEY